MKRLLASFVASALVACFAMAGCAGGSASSLAPASSGSSATASSEAVSTEISSSEAAASSTASGSSSTVAQQGDWEIPESLGEADLTDDEKETFQKALGAQSGADYEPIAVLATQVVAGENLAYLCRGASTDGAAQWNIVVVYKDLQGNASITGAAAFDLADIKTTDEAASTEAAGAWEVRQASYGVAMTAEAAQAFTKAIASYDDLQINPLALLGTQQGDGTDYLILGTHNGATQDSAPAVFVVNVHESADGAAELIDESKLDLLAYVS